jgi:hypothetical protein
MASPFSWEFQEKTAKNAKKSSQRDRLRENFTHSA